MSVHLYFSLIPEALIASMLTPEQFGQYYATGYKFKSKGQALFFEIDPEFRDPFFDIEGCYKRCKPKSDGSPKNSVYISMYQVLEHLPIAAVGKLYLTTAMGATLAIERGKAMPPIRRELHMYQALAPINSLVVSSLDPRAYYTDISTKPSHSFSWPGVCFVELELGRLATDPESGQEGDLPYTFIQHLREALLEVTHKDKHNKLVHRVHSLEFPYRMVKDGFYLGIGADLVHYPMPAHAVLRRDHITWWKSANL